MALRLQDFLVVWMSCSAWALPSKEFLQRVGQEADGPWPRPVIIDTDMDTDDQMAVAYLLGEPSIEVKAITVLADGWSNQWSGVQNAMRLTEFFGQPDIPVAYSPRYNPDTQLDMQEPNRLPKPSLLNGIDNYLSEYVPLDFNERPPSWMFASTLIRNVLSTSNSSVDIIALGPLTNIAQVLQEDPSLFKRKVKCLYMSGGLIVPRNVSGSGKVWPYSSEGPKATSFTGKPAGTSWNIFSDPIAANSVFSFGVPVVMGTSPFQDGVQFNTTDTKFIPGDCPGRIDRVLREMILQLPAADNEKGAKEKLIKYWDQSHAVLAVQMIRYNGQKHAAVCTEWASKKFAVMMEGGDNATVSGRRYALLLENKYGKPATECLSSNATQMKVAYYSGLCRIFYEASWY